MTDTTKSQRIDKWLWHARFIKTRSLAQKLVTSGNVRVDREKVTSASRAVKPGNVLTLSIQNRILIVEILDVAKRRGPYSEACLLYRDLTPSEEKSTEQSMSVTGQENLRHGKPDKQDRRKAIRLKRNYPVD